MGGLGWFRGLGRWVLEWEIGSGAAGAESGEFWRIEGAVWGMGRWVGGVLGVVIWCWVALFCKH